MLSKLSYRIIYYLVKLGSFLRLVPYTFDMESLVIGLRPETKYFGLFRSQYLGYRVLSVIVIGNMVFGGLRLLQAIYYLNTSFQDCMFNLFIFLVSCLANIVQLSTIYQPAELAKVVTKYLQRERRLSGE